MTDRTAIVLNLLYRMELSLIVCWFLSIFLFDKEHTPIEQGPPPSLQSLVIDRMVLFFNSPK
jgi:hypothetical protein